MNVDPGTGVAGGFDARGERVLGQRERCVGADHARAASGRRYVREEPLVLADARRGALAARPGRSPRNSTDDRMPSSSSASATTSSDPSIALGEAWWSTTVVVPARSASMPPTSADARIDSSSSARSSRHQIRCRICRKFAGESARRASPAPAPNRGACGRRRSRGRRGTRSSPGAARALRERRPTAGDPAALDHHVRRRGARRDRGTSATSPP